MSSAKPGIQYFTQISRSPNLKIHKSALLQSRKPPKSAASAHNSLQQNCFAHKLEPVTSLWCVCVVVCVLCGSLFCFLFGFVFGVSFVFLFLFFVFWFLLSKCDKGFGLCIGPLPVYFCGHYSVGPCTSQLINFICNMLGNMLNDLAEAIRRWTEKKCCKTWLKHGL